VEGEVVVMGAMAWRYGRRSSQMDVFLGDMIVRNYDERIVIGDALCRRGVAVNLLKRGFMDLYHGKLRSAPTNP
jgi:hypothetical protein